MARNEPKPKPEPERSPRSWDEAMGVNTGPCDRYVENSNEDHQGSCDKCGYSQTFHR